MAQGQPKMAQGQPKMAQGQEVIQETFQEVLLR